MNAKEILEKYKQSEISLEDSLAQLSDKGFDDIGFASIDTNRFTRTGIPEVIYAAGKTVQQVRDIAQRMFENKIDILATRATIEMYEAIKEIIPEARYNELAKTISYQFNKPMNSRGYIVVVAAGTSDMPVGEEAAVTARFLNNEVKTIYDVGVAGIHRLFDKLDVIRGARVVIVVAGMEGALASVVGGLVRSPIIAVPTSVGYGANLGGISALLSMLNSCASGVSVVNIDNGFGAACQASLINNL